MIERTIKQTVKEYDENGNVIKETIIETEEKETTNIISPDFYCTTTTSRNSSNGFYVENTSGSIAV